MPNVLDTPMKRTDKIVITHNSAYARFSAKKAHIEINSVLNRGVQINSRYKSEQVSIGINDYYLASVTFRRRTFPIFIVLSILSGLVFTFLFIGTADSEAQAVWAGVFFFTMTIVFIILYFYTRMARLSLRIADDQDYEILLSSSAVNDSKLMQEFIQKILMNALKVEDNGVHQATITPAQQPPPVSHQPPPVSHQPPPVSHQPPPVSHQPPPVSHQPPPVSHQPPPSGAP